MSLVSTTPYARAQMRREVLLSEGEGSVKLRGSVAVLASMLELGDYYYGIRNLPSI